MRGRDDLIRGWLRKAGSDFVSLDATIAVEAYDTACFHAQQAAEKCLKAYLDHEEVDFPFTHNLTKLVELCAARDSAFSALLSTVEPLTPYAVETRYDSEFWPEREVAEEARALAQSVRSFVMTRLPARLWTDEEDSTAVS